MLRERWRQQHGTIIADVIIFPIYMFLLFATIFFMYYLRARVIMYEAAYLSLSVANNAIELTDSEAEQLGVTAAERFLDRINAVTIRSVDVTRTVDGSLYKLEATIEGGWEPGPIINLAGEVSAEVCLQANHGVFTTTVAGVTDCP